jgi:hypothetical protein
MEKSDPVHTLGRLDECRCETASVIGSLLYQPPTSPENANLSAQVRSIRWNLAALQFEQLPSSSATGWLEWRVWCDPKISTAAVNCGEDR